METKTSTLLDGLNKQQREAVLQTEGPLLILAGAGSGKTRVLTHRVGYLIEQGVLPWQILAITFTNKAAGEMRERVDALLPDGGQGVFVSTFHSMCVRMLRRDIDRLGYARDFTIYDSDDQRTLMRQVIKDMSLDSKMFRDRALLSYISSAKNEMLDWKDCANEAVDFYEKKRAAVFEQYQKQLAANNALDFDDLLVLTVRLFKEFPDVLAGWQERFHYIMVDEYQDTNTVQFELVRLLSLKYHNLCVVGDDDQSIYKFRGANIENILSFERSFPGAKVIKLEQNYRSTKRILAAANAVIHNNASRKDKTLWTANDEGELPTFREYETAAMEADAVIREARDCGIPLKDQAVLYRTNAQSRILEEKCIQLNVPYIMVGGVNFYQRREIKDMLSYLRLIANGVDDLSCERILNVPKRGIGQTSVERVRSYAAEHGLSLYEALKQADKVPSIGAAAKKIKGFVALIESFREKAAEGSALKDLIQTVLTASGYQDMLQEEGEIEAKTRLENIEELMNKAASYEEDPNETDRSLSGFLEDVSLVADIDRTNDSDDALTLMTLHAAKGLEFDKVYLCGMEEGLFPSAASINADDPEEEIAEERRLCYVGITRARKQLRMTSARERMVNGETRYEMPSRFIEEIPEDCLKKTMRRARQTTWEAYDDDYDRPIPKRGFVGKSAFANKFGGFGQTGNSQSYGIANGAGASGKGAGYGYSNGQNGYDIAQAGYGSNSGYGQEAYGAGDKHHVIGAYGSLDFSRTGGGHGKTSHGREKTREEARKALFAMGKGMPSQAGTASGIGAGGTYGLGYEKGDRVRHIKFGDGTVEDIQKEPRDYEVTVNFDEYGVKKMFAKFAKLQKI